MEPNLYLFAATLLLLAAYAAPGAWPLVILHWLATLTPEKIERLEAIVKALERLAITLIAFLLLLSHFLQYFREFLP